MEEKKVIKISLSTFFLILAIIAIIVMGIFIYKLNNDKTIEIQKSTELQAKVNSLNGTVSELQEKINKISETVTIEDTQKNTSSNNLQEKINKVSETVSIEDTQKNTSSNNSLYIIKEINISDQQSLYNFNTKIG